MNSLPRVPENRYEWKNLREGSGQLRLKVEHVMFQTSHWSWVIPTGTELHSPSTMFCIFLGDVLFWTKKHGILLMNDK